MILDDNAVCYSRESGVNIPPASHVRESVAHGFYLVSGFQPRLHIRITWGALQTLNAQVSPSPFCSRSGLSIGFSEAPQVSVTFSKVENHCFEHGLK